MVRTSTSTVSVSAGASDVLGSHWSPEVSPKYTVAPLDTVAARSRLTVVLVCDVSGSMGGRPLELVRATALLIRTTLQPEDASTSDPSFLGLAAARAKSGSVASLSLSLDMPADEVATAAIKQKTK